MIAPSYGYGHDRRTEAAASWRGQPLLRIDPAIIGIIPPADVLHGQGGAARPADRGRAPSLDRRVLRPPRRGRPGLGAGGRWIVRTATGSAYSLRGRDSSSATRAPSPGRRDDRDPGGRASDPVRLDTFGWTPGTGGRAASSGASRSTLDGPAKRKRYKEGAAIEEERVQALARGRAGHRRRVPGAPRRLAPAGPVTVPEQLAYPELPKWPERRLGGGPARPGL